MQTALIYVDRKGGSIILEHSGRQLGELIDKMSPHPVELGCTAISRLDRCGLYLWSGEVEEVEDEGLQMVGEMSLARDYDLGAIGDGFGTANGMCTLVGPKIAR